jgi:beta-glucosidase
MTIQRYRGRLRTSAMTAVVLGLAAGGAGTAKAGTVHEDAAVIVSKLTPQEKVEQLLNVAPAIPRLGIPRYNWWTDSLHGAIGLVPTTNSPSRSGSAPPSMVRWSKGRRDDQRGECRASRSRAADGTL